jgi:hypothetical protein
MISASQDDSHVLSQLITSVMVQNFTCLGPFFHQNESHIRHHAMAPVLMAIFAILAPLVYNFRISRRFTQSHPLFAIILCATAATAFELNVRLDPAENVPRASNSDGTAGTTIQTWSTSKVADTGFVWTTAAADLPPDAFPTAASETLFDHVDAILEGKAQLHNFRRDIGQNE